MRFVTFAALGLLIGLALFACDMAAWITLIASAGYSITLVGASGGEVSIQTPVLIGVVAYLLLDMLLLAGSAGTLNRAAWARRSLLTYAWGEFAVALAVVTLLAILSVSGHHGRSRFAFLPALTIAIRCPIAYACYRICHSMYADFYFKPSPSHPQQEPEAPPRVALERKTPRFLIRGVEARTGQPTEYQSSAATESLARKSALALGLDPASISIESIPQSA